MISMRQDGAVVIVRKGSRRTTSTEIRRSSVWCSWCKASSVLVGSDQAAHGALFAKFSRAHRHGGR